MGRANEKERGVCINHNGVDFVVAKCTCIKCIICFTAFVILLKDRHLKWGKHSLLNHCLTWRGYSLIRLCTTLLVSNFCSVMLRDTKLKQDYNIRILYIIFLIKLILIIFVIS